MAPAVLELLDETDTRRRILQHALILDGILLLLVAGALIKHPVMLGSGIPLFHPMGRQINLELLECTPFKNGCVYVRYRVKR